MPTILLPRANHQPDLSAKLSIRLTKQWRAMKVVISQTPMARYACA